MKLGYKGPTMYRRANPSPSACYYTITSSLSPSFSFSIFSLSLSLSYTRTSLQTYSNGVLLGHMHHLLSVQRPFGRRHGDCVLREIKTRKHYYMEPDCCNSVKLSLSVYTTITRKAIPLQAWTGPEGSRRLSLPDFKTIGT